jgi:hypothetical protein
MLLLRAAKAMDGMTSQGNDISLGVAPQAPVVNIENTWKAKGKLSLASNLSPQSRTGDPNFLRKKVEEQSARFVFSNCTGYIHGFNICGTCWLLPAHYVRTILAKSPKTVSITRCNTTFASYNGVVDWSSLEFCPDRDFCILRIHMPPGTDLRGYICEGAVGSRCEGELCLHGKGWVSTGVMLSSRQTLEPPGSVPMVNHPIFSYAVDAVTVNGDCGSVVAETRKGSVVLYGFHVGIGKLDARIKYVSGFPKAWLMERSGVLVQGDVSESFPERLVRGDDVHEKCPVRFVDLADRDAGCSVVPLGCLHATNSFKSSVVDNTFASFWKGFGMVTNKVRPVFCASTCADWLPRRNFMLAAVEHKDTIPIDDLKLCADHYAKRFDRIPLSEIQKQVVIDEETNLHGCPFDNFISSMDFRTGAGFPYNKPKYQVLTPIERDGYPDGTFTLSQQIRESIETSEKKLAKSIRPNFVYNSSFKDEAISLLKMTMGKIRIFQAIPIEGLFLLRKYFLSTIALFQRFNFVSEAAVGMDATGPDWDDIREHVLIDGWKTFCGDYSNYDQRQSASLMERCWLILIDLAMKSGNFSQTSRVIMVGLYHECIYCLVNFFGDIFYLNGTNPSGHAATVVINSIANSLYIRFAWLRIFGSLDDFDENVRMMTYGDDNIVSVSPAFQEKFNQVTVSSALGSVGVIYTDAQKTGNMTPFVDFSEISFLKRKFVQVGYGYASPLEMASIHKMLLIGVQKSEVNVKDRLVSVLQSSVMEMFHHGRDEFDIHRERVMRCVQEYDLTGFVDAKGGIPTWETLLEGRQKKNEDGSRLSRLEAALGVSLH